MTILKPNTRHPRVKSWQTHFLHTLHLKSPKVINNVNTAWAEDFETPTGSSTFFSFFLFLGSIGRKKYLQAGRFEVCSPYSKY
jgi:hypothetical protein